MVPYKDILEKATPTVPTKLQEKHPTVYAVLGKVEKIIAGIMVIGKWVELRSHKSNPEPTGKYQLMSDMYNTAQIISKLDRFIDDRKFLENPESVDILGLDFVRKEMQGLPKALQKKIIQRAYSFLKNFTNIRIYTRMERYKNNPKQLLADIRGIAVSDIVGRVTVDIEKYAIIFYIENADDYIRVHGDVESAKYSGGFFGGKSHISDLEQTASYQKGAYNPEDISTKVHEERHARNRPLRFNKPHKIHNSHDENGLNYMLNCAKDEIIAYMTDSANDWPDIYIILMIPKGIGEDNKLYDYRKYLSHITDSTGLAEKYNLELGKLLQIAFKLRESGIPNALDMLAIMPAENWGLLEGWFSNPSKFVKHNRASPFLFGKAFDSMKDEYSVLQEMKEISPDHVPELYYFDKYGKFYVTERYGSNEHRNIDSIPEDLITSLENTILDFHKHGVAHGDLKGNILFETDKHGVAIGFKIIDPVGISNKVNPKFFEQARELDLDAIRSFKVIDRKM